MSIATTVDKCLSNHVITLLEEVKDMKIDRRKKNAKTRDIKVHFDTVRSVFSDCFFIIYNKVKQ